MLLSGGEGSCDDKHDIEDNQQHFNRTEQDEGMVQISEIQIRFYTGKQIDDET
jgi:hypothetical protein